MEVIELAEPADFRSFVDPLVLQNESCNSLFLGITGTLIDRPDVFDEFHLWAVSDDGVPVGAAAMTPPNNLLLANNASQESLIALVNHIDERGLELPGIQGNRPCVDTFCELWAETGDVEVRLEVNMGVHALTEVSETAAVPGQARAATIDDFDLVLEWFTAFLDEADPLSPRTDLERSVRNRFDVGSDVGGIWLWVLGEEAVALSGYAGRTPNGIRISPVYTPPDARRRGYATALVARQSGWLLEQGRTFCFLYTDMANPTANSIYRRIGYRKVADARRYGFTPQNRRGV